MQRGREGGVGVRRRENLSCASMKGQFIRSCSGRQNILPQCFTDCLDEEWELTAQCRAQTRAGPGPRLQQHRPGTARCKHPWGVEDQGHTGMRRVQRWWRCRVVIGHRGTSLSPLAVDLDPPWDPHHGSRLSYVLSCSVLLDPHSSFFLICDPS